MFNFEIKCKTLSEMESLKSGNLINIFGETGVGKTEFLLHYALEKANNGHRAMFVSLDGSSIEIFNKILNYYVGYDIREKFTDKFGTIDNDKYSEEALMIMNGEKFKRIRENLFIVAPKCNSWDAISENIEKSIKGNGIEFAFIDGINLLKDYQHSNVSRIWNCLKRFARKNRIQIFTGSLCCNGVSIKPYESDLSLVIERNSIGDIALKSI